MNATAETIVDQSDPVPSGTEIQLGDLGKLRAMGMAFATELHRIAMAKAPEAEDSPLVQDRNLALSFTRVSRAVRQIVVLEQELMGLRAVPVRHAANGNARGSRDRDSDGDGDREGSDLNDLDDYDDYNCYSDRLAEDEAMAERILAELIVIQARNAQRLAEAEGSLGGDNDSSHRTEAESEAEAQNPHPAATPDVEAGKPAVSGDYVFPDAILPARRRGRGPP